MHAHCAHRALLGAGRVHLRHKVPLAPSGMHRRSGARAPHCAAAQQKGRTEQETASQQTIGEPLRAPGSASNFVGLPADPEDIRVTTPVSDRQMQVNRPPSCVCSYFSAVAEVHLIQVVVLLIVWECVHISARHWLRGCAGEN